MFIARVGDRRGEVPGLQSVATAIGTLCSRSIATGGFLLFLERVEGAREQDRDRTSGSHRLRAGLVEMLEMIGRKRVDIRRRARRPAGSTIARRGA